MDLITLDHRWPHRRSARVSRREDRQRTIVGIVIGTLGALLGGWVLVRFGPPHPFSRPLGLSFAALVAAGLLFGVVRIVRRHIP